MRWVALLAICTGGCFDYERLSSGRGTHEFGVTDDLAIAIEDLLATDATLDLWNASDLAVRDLSTSTDLSKPPDMTHLMDLSKPIDFGGPFNTLSFAPGVPYAAGTQPAAVAVGDFNGDNKLDIAVANRGSNNVSVLVGVGDGTFLAAVNYATGTGPFAIAVANLDGDNKPDIVTANFGSDDVSVLLNNGAGTFAGAANFAAGSGPRTLAVADFDGDQHADVVVGNNTGSTVSCLHGNANGTFQALVSSNAGGTPQSVASADLDSDLHQDVVVAITGNTSAADGRAYVLLGNGNCTFKTPAVHMTNGGQTAGVAIGDLNGGALDVVTANLGVVSVSTGDVSVLVGGGAGALAAGVAYGADSGPQAVVVGDFNLDGQGDVAAANGSGVVSVLRGNGNGTLQTRVNYAAGSNPIAIAVGDFNNDGKPDLVTANYGSNNVSVLLNTSM